LEALDRTGRRAETLVVFVSDNGGDQSLPPVVDPRLQQYDPATLGGPQSYTGYGPGWGQVSNTPFRRYKRYAHEGGIAVPLIIHGRGFPATRDWRREPVTLLDLAPTFLAAAGSYDGAQVAWRGRNLAGRRAAGFSSGWEHMGHRAYREGDYKIVAADGEPWELYNLAADRCERRDLASAEPRRLAALASAYARWAKSAGVLPWPVALQGRFG
jgi:arylsulfatase